MGENAPKRRPKPPPYPRPVPDFVVEELPAGPADAALIVSHGGYGYNEGDEIMSEQRAAKRRRIEASAAAYLRGETLYIMSAQLKGPFKEGWKNPWAKRRLAQQVANVVDNVSVEIPETARKGASSEEEEQAVKMTRNALEPRPVSRSSETKDLRRSDKIPRQPSSPFVSKVQHLVGELSPKVSPQVKEKRVEAWLRMNEAGTATSEILVHSSPTPVVQHHNLYEKDRDHGDAVGQSSQSVLPFHTTPVANSAMSDTLRQTQRPNESSEANRRIQQLTHVMQNALTEPPADVTNGLHAEVRKLASANPTIERSRDESRAEFAILKAKRRVGSKGSLESLVVPPGSATVHPQTAESDHLPLSRSEDVSKQQPHMADRHAIVTVSGTAREHPKTGTGQLYTATPIDGTDRAQDEFFATAPQFELDPRPSGEQPPLLQPNHATGEPSTNKDHGASLTNASRPALSTVVSNVSTTDMLPSAQPRPEPVLSPSSLTRDDKMISIQRLPSTSDQTDKHAYSESKSIQQTNQTASERIQGVAKPDQPDAQHHDINTTISVSTSTLVQKTADIKQRGNLGDDDPSKPGAPRAPRSAKKSYGPDGVVKTHADKKRKKTSFVIDASTAPTNVSIKNAMKAKVSKNLGGSPILLSEKNNPDAALLDEENDLRHKRQKSLPIASQPKGILKSSNQVSSSPSLRKSKSAFSTGREPDERSGNRGVPVHSGQNGVAEDNFNLDAAIDDLGSFLGTWDAEKEASSLELEPEPEPEP